MKNFFTLLICCCLFSSCSDDSTDATLTNSSTTTALASKPEAKPMYDNSYMGIYKGIVIGNISGALYIDILNDHSIWAKIQTDNHQTYVLENVPLSGGGKSMLSNLRKYRFANENISFDIKLDDTGNNITVSNFNFFSDTNADVCLLKEKSTSQIKCYTGIFTSNDESGNVNFTTDGELTVKGLSKNIHTDATSVVGEIDITFPDDGLTTLKSGANPIIEYQLNANLHFGQISGPLNRYTFDGNWMHNNNEIGKWNATRIL